MLTNPPRYYLRKLSYSDLKKYPEVFPSLNDLSAIPSKTHYDRIMRDPNSHHLVVECKEKGVIGFVGINSINWISRKGSLSVYFPKKGSISLSGKFKAIQCSIEFSFRHLNIHKLKTSCYASDKEQCELLEMAGFINEVVLREHIKLGNHYEDIVVYGIINFDADA